MTLKLTLRKDVWYVTGTVMLPTGERRRVRRSTGYTKWQKQWASAVMSRIMKEAMEGGRTGSDRAVTVDEMVDYYLGRPEGVGETDRLVLNRLARDMRGKTLEGVGLSGLTRHVQGRKNSAGTMAREVNAINAALAYGRDNGLSIPDDMKLRRPSVDDSRTRWLTAADRDRLIAACDGEIQPVVTFLFWTGARLGEAFDLTWGSVGDRQVSLVTRKGKEKRRRVRSVPLVGPAVDAVGRRGGDAERVFTGPRGAGWSRQHFYPRWRRALDRAGIEDFRPHDCRHTFASLLVQKGVGLREVADLLGHSSLSMVMRYAHLGPAQLRDAVSLLETG